MSEITKKHIQDHYKRMRTGVPGFSPSKKAGRVMGPGKLMAVLRRKTGKTK